MVLEYLKKKKKKTRLWIEPDHNEAEYLLGQTSILYTGNYKNMKITKI